MTERNELTAICNSMNKSFCFLWKWMIHSFCQYQKLCLKEVLSVWGDLKCLKCADRQELKIT